MKMFVKTVIDLRWRVCTMKATKSYLNDKSNFQVCFISLLYGWWMNYISSKFIVFRSIKLHGKPNWRASFYSHCLDSGGCWIEIKAKADYILFVNVLGSAQLWEGIWLASFVGFTANESMHEQLPIVCVTHYLLCCHFCVHLYVKVWPYSSLFDE